MYHQIKENLSEDNFFILEEQTFLIFEYLILKRYKHLKNVLLNDMINLLII